MNNQISRDEVRSAIEDKLSAQFSVSGEVATNEQIFQATAIVLSLIHISEPTRRITRSRMPSSA